MKNILKSVPYLAAVVRKFRVYKTLFLPVAYRNELGFKFNGPKTMQTGEFERAEANAFEQLIRDRQLFINVGANAGFYVLKALRVGVKTIAFEPDRQNCKVLMRNVEANKFEDECLILPVALSDTCRVARFYGDGTGASLIRGWAGAPKSYQLVPTMTLDSFRWACVDNKSLCILIDAEGSEYEVLLGAVETLSESRDLLLIVELSGTEHAPDNGRGESNYEKVHSFLTRLGYRAYSSTQPHTAYADQEIAKFSQGLKTPESQNFLYARHLENDPHDA